MLAILIVGLCLSGCNHEPTPEDEALSRELLQLERRFFSVLGAVFGTALAVLLLGPLALSRRRLMVFITYQHDGEHHANRVAQILSRNGIRVLILPYRPREHDDVLRDVKRFLRKSHILVTLPGSSKSFVDAEILAASVLNKPVLILKVPEVTSLPDTAFEGYPVFDMAKLEAHGWTPLIRFCRYVGRHWTDYLTSLRRALAGILPLGAGCLLVLWLVNFVGNLAPALLYLWNPTLALKVVFSMSLVPLVALALLISLSLLVPILAKLKAIRTARQTIISGRLTFQILEQSLGDLAADRAILQCLEQQPLGRRDR